MFWRWIPRLSTIGILAFLVFGSIPSAAISPGQNEAPSHALVFVIHGDGDYLYHQDGRPRHADRNALRTARLVARNAPAADVFIFHQIPRRKVLGIVARPDGRLIHYRAGELVGETAYHRDPESLLPEARLYRERRAPGVTGHTFLYYGHDIPENDSSPYHSSYPSAVFGVDQLIEGLTAMAAGDPFDLIVLSTCNNGSPGTIAALAPLGRYILASPGDLHLSHIDSHPLHDVGSTRSEMGDVAPRLAEWAFRRLADRVHTSVTLTLYDTEALTPHLKDLATRYAELRRNLNREGAPVLADFVDCTDAMEVPLEALPGVRAWYRPPAFGRESGKTTHSGWGCPATPRTRL